MGGEVEAARSIDDLPLRDGEVGEDGEAGEVDLGGWSRVQVKTRTEPELTGSQKICCILTIVVVALPVSWPRPRLGRRWPGSRRRG